MNYIEDNKVLCDNKTNLLECTYTVQQTVYLSATCAVGVQLEAFLQEES